MTLSNKRRANRSNGLVGVQARKKKEMPPSYIAPDPIVDENNNFASNEFEDMNMEAGSKFRDACAATDTIGVESLAIQTDFVKTESQYSQTSIECENKSTQTPKRHKLDNVIDQIPLKSLSDLLHVLKDQFKNWNSLHTRIVSVIFYVLLRQNGASYGTAEDVLKQFGCHNIARRR